MFWRCWRFCDILGMFNISNIFRVWFLSQQPCGQPQPQPKPKPKPNPNPKPKPKPKPTNQLDYQTTRQSDNHADSQQQILFLILGWPAGGRYWY